MCTKKYNVPVGLSDHSGNIYSSLMAIMLGAEIIEAHVVFDKRMFGPDSSASLSINQFSELVRGVRFLEIARGISKEPEVPFESNSGFDQSPRPLGSKTSTKININIFLQK